MLNAEIIGSEERSNGVNEKPTLYSTVIRTHKTAIKKPSDFGSRNGFTTSAGSLAAFNQVQNELSRLGQGQIAIPVKLEMESSLVNDPTLANYETPNFLNTKERNLGVNEGKFLNVPKLPMLTPSFVAQSQKDLKMIQQKLGNSKTKKEKINACKNYIFIKICLNFE